VRLGLASAPGRLRARTSADMTMLNTSFVHEMDPCPGTAAVCVGLRPLPPANRRCAAHSFGDGPADGGGTFAESRSNTFRVIRSTVGSGAPSKLRVSAAENVTCTLACHVPPASKLPENSIPLAATRVACVLTNAAGGTPSSLPTNPCAQSVEPAVKTSPPALLV
jgi:hypothetical protein